MNHDVFLCCRYQLLKFQLIFFCSFQALFTCDLIWPNTSLSTSSAMFCVSQTNVIPAAVSKSAFQTTANGLCVMNHAATSLAAIQKNSLALPKSPVKPNTGQFISPHVLRSTCDRLDGRDSHICQKDKMRSMSIPTSLGGKILCSLWSSEQMKVENMLYTRATTSKLSFLHFTLNFAHFLHPQIPEFHRKT